MNKNNNLIQTDDLMLTDEIVVAFLHDNPDFLTRNPELVTTLRFADNQRGVVSLVERQQQMLRKKIHNLEEEITQLMTVASHNENLFAVYSDLYLVLLDCHTITDLLSCLEQTVTQLLSLSAMKLWLPNTAKVAGEHDSLVTQDCQDIVANRLADEPFYFGRLQQQEQLAIFGHGVTGSVVLIKLEYLGDFVGMLVVSSDDAEHFDPRMDTLLLGQFRKIVGKLLHNLLVN